MTMVQMQVSVLTALRHDLVSMAMQIANHALHGLCQWPALTPIEQAIKQGMLCSAGKPAVCGEGLGQGPVQR